MYNTMPAVTQDQQAASDGALMTDAAAGWALIREMELAWQDVAAGAHYCADDIDWAAIENEMWGE